MEYCVYLNFIWYQFNNALLINLKDVGILTLFSLYKISIYPSFSVFIRFLLGKFVY
jgi:hypothetical protein